MHSMHHQCKYTKTNLNKSTIATETEEEISIEDNILNTQTSGRILGHTISNTGYGKHIKERYIQVKGALTKLYRFKNVQAKIKIHLIKSLVLPVLQYPPIHTIT